MTYIGIALESDAFFGSGDIDFYLAGFDVDNFSEFPYATILTYVTDGSNQRMREICQEFIQDTQDALPESRTFIANTRTGEFLSALEAMIGTDIIVLSISTYANINEFPNIEHGLSFCYSDDIATQCLVNIMGSLIRATKRSPALFIINYRDQDGSFNLYSEGYVQGILKALDSSLVDGPQLVEIYTFNNGDVDELRNIFTRIRDMLTPLDIIVYIAPSEILSDCKEVLNELTDPYFFYISDIGDGATFTFKPTVYATVLIPSYSLYTQNTKALYQRVYDRNPKLLEYTSFIGSFLYDIARQLLFMTKTGLSFTKQNFFITDSSLFYQPAALITNWPDPVLNRPRFAKYFNGAFFDDQWSQHVTTFNRLVLGSSKSQKTSCTIQNVCGLSPQLQPGGYFSETMIWQKFFNPENKWIFTKLQLTSVTIDTSEEYCNNEYCSQNVGTYNLLANARRDLNAIRENTGGTFTLEVVTDNTIIPYPLPTISITTSV